MGKKRKQYVLKGREKVNIVGLTGAVVGQKTRIAMDHALATLKKQFPLHQITLIDLSEHALIYSDGRPYESYTGDTGYVTKTLMAADAIIVGTPTFQASIPGALKNVFDLLPIDAFKQKKVGIIVTAGSQRHFLMVEQQLKPILAYMKADLLPSYVFLEEADYNNQTIINQNCLERLDELAIELVKGAEQLEERKSQ